MKIAILLSGHLRTWNQCKQNFIDTLYDINNHQIDIFIDTYYQVYRTDYTVFNEHLKNTKFTNNEARNLFNELNVVSFNIEQEVVGITSQAGKLLQVYDSFVNYEHNYGLYDLVVKSRFDIILHNKINYNDILSECKNNSKTLYISRGAVNCLPLDNDLLAIATSETMKLYMNRFRVYPEIIDTHESMRIMARNNHLSIKNTIDVSFVRPN